VLLAKALVQRSTASTLLGHADASPPALQEAIEIAVRREEWGLAESALAELVFAHVSRARFADALDAANRCLEAARRSEPSALATAHHNRAALWYAVDRFEDALADLLAAESIMRASVGTPERWGRGGIAGPTMLYAIYYLRGLTQARLGGWESAIECVDVIAKDAARVIASQRYGCAYRLLAIDVLLSRGASGDIASVALQRAERLMNARRDAAAALWGGTRQAVYKR